MATNSMEHSAAILDDASKAIEAAASMVQSEHHGAREAGAEDESQQRNNYDRRKRKHDGPEHNTQRGRGGRNDNKRHKKGDMGRAEYLRTNPDKRQKTDATREKRREGNAPDYAGQFSQAEIDAEERRPKRKCAVMVGYSGTGYKGMQISASEKTIEGDLFKAFVEAGAISKANADDPKKASLMRCARTDKGVHAAGNMISLKLILEDHDVVAKINEHLSPQIRVWGIERTIGSFSCYQACDSRWYEYLIPSHAFLPPHPSSWLAKKLEELADATGDREGYEGRQQEVNEFWAEAEKIYIEPVLGMIDGDLKADVIRALKGEDEADAVASVEDVDAEQNVKTGNATAGGAISSATTSEKTEEAAIIIREPDPEDTHSLHIEPRDLSMVDEAQNDGRSIDTATTAPEDLERLLRLRAATKQLRQAYIAAKRRHRIPASRIARIQAALNKYVGTVNFHNYTVQKTFNDPSAKRHIKSFIVSPKPILIGADEAESEKSEWLSLKVHGQSFMMHQIRKMVGMITLLVRCGASLSTLEDSLTASRYSIPKVPGLGLLLERPVFDSYNELTAPKHGREKLDFGKFEKELLEFKEREIYQRIFREEEERNEFAKFINHVDNFKDAHFLWVTSGGAKAVRDAQVGKAIEVQSRSGEMFADED